jgi:hypothetical protein
VNQNCESLGSKGGEDDNVVVNVVSCSWDKRWRVYWLANRLLAYRERLLKVRRLIGDGDSGGSDDDDDDDVTVAKEINLIQTYVVLIDSISITVKVFVEYVLLRTQHTTINSTR